MKFGSIFLDLITITLWSIALFLNLKFEFNAKRLKALLILAYLVIISNEIVSILKTLGI